jgi:hypothetical protein
MKKTVGDAMDDLVAGAYDTLICEGVDVERIEKWGDPKGAPVGYNVDGQRACTIDVEIPHPVHGILGLASVKVTLVWNGDYVHLNARSHAG